MTDKLTPFNGLSPAEAERLTLLAEECAEVIQAVTKIQRHGYESSSPSDPHHTTNRTLLLREIADVSTIMTMLLRNGDLPHPPTDDMIYTKIEKLKKYTHHQEDSR